MKYVGILGVGALCVAGFAYYTLFAGPSVPQAADSTDRDSQAITEVVADPSSAEREEFAGAGSINNLIARGESLECQITYIPNPLEPEVTGSFFTADGQVRGDFLVPSPDLSGQILSSVIFTGSTLYAWSEIDGEQYGFQMQTDTFVSDNEMDTTPIPSDQEVQYTCLSWPNVDRTIFVPPTDVLFTDMSDMTGLMETGTIYLEQEGAF